MLKTIFIVTIALLNPGSAEEAWREHLEYRTVERGEIGAALAGAWGLPQAEGSDYVLMQPASGAETYIRFVATDARGNYAPMKTLGWNAVELLVQDPDDMARALADAPFEVIGPPAFLTEKQNVRAMQALGPADELLYLTRIIDPARSSFDLGQAVSRIDRVFIMVLGTADMAETTAWYTDALGQPVTGPWPYRVGVLSRAWGLPEDTVYPLSIAQLQGQFLIEMDEYPAAAERREATAAGLPYGPAMVSFGVASLEAIPALAGEAGVAVDTAPYNGRRVAALRGPSGEWIELVGGFESPAPQGARPVEAPGESP